MFIADLSQLTVAGDLCETGRLQSPVTVDISQTNFMNFSSFTFSQFYKNSTLFQMVIQPNKTLVLTALLDDPSQLVVRGGCVPGVYTFQSAHIHWPRSEHLIVGENFSAEAHFIHKDLTTGELAVFGYFFSLNSSLSSDTGSSSWESILTQLTNRTFTLPKGLASLMSGNNDRFICYNGSLTTPPCTEGIRWILVSSAIKIRSVHISQLQSTFEQAYYREAQPLNGRMIRRSFPSVSWLV